MNVNTFSSPVTTGGLGSGTETAVVPNTADCQSWSNGVQLAVADSFDGVGITPSEWDRAVERLGGPIYMTWDWLRTWWEFYGHGCLLRLMVFRKDGEIVGLLPLYLQRVGVPPFRMTVARLVGANIPPKVFDPPLHAAWTLECLRLVLARLAQDACGFLSIGPVSDEFLEGRWDPDVLQQGFERWDVRKDGAGVYTWFPLPETHEAYLSSLAKNEQRNRKKYELRLLRKEYEVAVQVLGHGSEPLAAAFEEFVRLHTEQWRAERLLGHFGAWPRGLEYNRALVQAQARHQRVRLLRILASGHTVCAQYAFAWRDRWFWELPARAVGPAWDRLSLGPTGIVVMIEQAIHEGRRRIEGGLGHYPYKLRLGAVERPVWTCRFLLCSPRQRVRWWVASAMRFALQWGYHKIWYRRIQPRLPECCKRPQWRVWLQHDF